MAQVARAQTEAAGGPHALKRLSVQFRGMGVPEAEITVTGSVAEVEGGIATVHAVAEQDGRAIIRNAEAELRPSSGRGAGTASYNRERCSHPAKS